jgi:hypothetical protein
MEGGEGEDGEERLFWEQSQLFLGAASLNTMTFRITTLSIGIKERHTHTIMTPRCLVL